MTARRSISGLEEQERRARNQLAVRRARLYSGRFVSPLAADRRVRELTRAHDTALRRLNRARESEAARVG